MNKKIAAIVFLSLLAIGCRQNNTVTPQRKDIVDAVFASGYIITTHEYAVTSHTEGYITDCLVQEGDSVNINDVLFQMNDSEQQAQLESALANYQYALYNSGSGSASLAQLKAQKLQIQNKLSNDSIIYTRYSQLVTTHAIAQIEYERAELAYNNSKQDLLYINQQIQNTQKNLDLEIMRTKAYLVAQQNNKSYFTLQSNTKGKILQVYKTAGELVKRGETVAYIGAGDYVVKLYISEDDIDDIKPNQDVWIELNTQKGKSFLAKIHKIYPMFDTKEQSFIAEAIFEEPIDNLRVGTQLQANIVLSHISNALVIPSTYLMPENYVFADGKKTKVKTGIKTMEWVEILNGIDENTTLEIQ